MKLDNRSVGKSSQPASSIRSIGGSPKRFLRKAFLLSFLAVGVASSGVRAVQAGVYGSVISVHNLSNNYVGIEGWEAGRQTNSTSAHAGGEVTAVISHMSLGGTITIRITDVNGNVLQQRNYPTNALDTDWYYYGN